MCKLPEFKYHPTPLETGAFKQDEVVQCGCCHQDTAIYYDRSLYRKKGVEYLCPDCIHSGQASKMFNGQFSERVEGFSNSDYSDESLSYIRWENTQTDFNNHEAVLQVLERTPSYSSWLGEVWLTHCNDCCAFVGYVGWEEVKNMLED